MSNINATMVKELREKTGAGIMESGRLVADRPLAAGYPQRLGHGGVFLLVGRIDMGVAIDDHGVLLWRRAAHRAPTSSGFRVPC
jgi:hypothetical protein